MEMYFLKSAACLAILMLFYKLLLEKESMHTFKRFYLLVAPLISFGIPFISFPEYVTPSSEGTAFFSEAAMAAETSRFPVFEVLLGTIYFTGVLLFGSRFLYNFRSLLKRARNNPKVKTADATHVLLKDPVNPHTFWNYIYLNRKKYYNKEIPQEVLDHELAHVKQKHSADILFMELLQALLWFLPLIYLLKKSVKLNHEFLADRAVLQKAENISLYQQILLSFSSGEPNELVNSINYQSIKKRFTVMKTQTSKKSVLFRTFLFLPLLAFLLYSFSGRETVILQNKTEAVEFFQEKATPKMIAEYNRLVKHYNSMPREKQMIKQEDINRIMYILSLLTPEQKEKAEKIKFDVPPPPAPKVSKNGDIPMPPPPPPAPPATKGGTVPPPPAPPVVGKGGDVPIPPPPPPSPIEAVKGWIEEGAEFYLNGTKVSGKEALQAVQENNGKNLSVQVQDSGSGKTVRISDNKR